MITVITLSDTWFLTHVSPSVECKLYEGKNCVCGSCSCPEFSRSLTQTRYSKNVCCILKKVYTQAVSSAGVAGGDPLKALDALLKALQQHSQVLGPVVGQCLEIKNAEQASGLCITAYHAGCDRQIGFGDSGEGKE